MTLLTLLCQSPTILAVLVQPGLDPPAAAPFIANRDGTPPATIGVPKQAAMLRHGERTTVPRGRDQAQAVPVDIYQYSSRLAAGPPAVYQYVFRETMPGWI